MNRLVSSYNRWSWGCLLRMTWWVVAAPWHRHPKRNGSNITCKVPHNAQGPFFFRRNDATGRRAFCFFLASDLRLGQWAREGDAIFVCGVHWSEHVNISRAIPSQSSWMRQIDGRLGRGPYLFSFFFFCLLLFFSFFDSFPPCPVSFSPGWSIYALMSLPSSRPGWAQGRLLLSKKGFLAYPALVGDR